MNEAQWAYLYDPRDKSTYARDMLDQPESWTADGIKAGIMPRDMTYSGIT